MSSIYASRAMGRSLGAFSAFAGGGRVIFGPFAFAESWTSDDFESASQFNQWVKPYLDQVGRKDLTWDPPSSSLKTRANTAWNAWKAAADAGSINAANYMDGIKGQMTDLTSRADALSLTGSLGHRNEGNEVSRYDAFNEITALIKKVANSGSQAAAAQAAAIAAGDVALPVASTVQQGATGVRGDITSGAPGQSRSPLVSTAGGSSMLLYIGLGAAALLAVGAVVVMRKRSSSVAGYRRRKRRSRR